MIKLVFVLVFSRLFHLVFIMFFTHHNEHAKIVNDAKRNRQ